MKVTKRISVIVGLGIVFLALGATGYLTYSRLRREAEILEINLENKSQALKIAKNELSEAKQKNVLFTEEKESLNKEIALQKEQITEIRQAKRNLQKQQGALSAEKQELESALAEAEQLYQKRVSVHKFESKIKEESLKKSMRKKEMEFFAEKEELEERIKKSKAELEEVIQKNQEFLTKLDESNQMIAKLKLEKGEENNQLNSMSQEDEWFRKEALKFHYNAGFIYDQNQQFELALIEYEKALEAVPDDADTHYNLAILYDEYRFNKRKAIEHYQAYLDLYPDAQDTVKVNYWISVAKKELKWEENKGLGFNGRY